MSTMDAPWSIAGGSGARGFVTELDGGPVHWVRWDSAGEATKDPVLLVHGLGGSHLNWTLVAPGLAVARSVQAIDLRGFGLTPGHPHGDTKVVANGLLVAHFIEQVVGAPVTLVGNSMGGMIGAMVASNRPDLVRRLVLVDPALPVARGRVDPLVAARFALFAIPGAGEAAMRRVRRSVDPELAARQLVDLCFGDNGRVRPETIEQAVELQALRSDPEVGLGDVERSFMRAARSLLATLARRPAYTRMLAGIDVPVLLIHGTHDRLVDVAAARDAACRYPAWSYAELDGVGHTPQLEVPEIFVEVVRSWLGDVPLGAAGPAPS